jgi:hypothetical protein
MMRRQNAERRGPRSVRWFLAIRLTVTGILLLAASSHAGVLTASWTAPSTNTDGSALTSVGLYRLYYSTSSSPCLGPTFVEVAPPTSSLATNQTISYQLSGLSTGSTYSVSVTAVTMSGKESACSAVATAVARGQSAIAPTGTVSFGNVVQSMDSVTITGTASVPAPSASSPVVPSPSAGPVRQRR